MWKRRISLIFILFAGSVLSQLAPKHNYSKGKLFDITVKKSGPYFGVQRGKCAVAELGGEFQWKHVKFADFKSQAVHMGFNYNFKYNVLGYDVGYWIKPSRIGLTYGGNLVLRTDFTETCVGFSPVLGYKLFGFHLQTGYHFLTRFASYMETNTFFISLRFVLINHRDVDNKNPLFKKNNSLISI